MRKSVMLLLLIVSYLSYKAQTPQGINYQAVARDNGGNLLANTAVSFRLALRQGSASGTFSYQETHNVTTNALGLATMVIGSGIVNVGGFSSIDWSNGPYFLQVELAVPPASFQIMGTSQLVSVPYALYAAHSADRAKPGKGITISNDSIHSSWSYIGNDVVSNNNGNVGIGTIPVNQKLEVNGGVSIGNTTNGSAGAIRYTGSDFEGATGTGWQSLTKSSVSYFEKTNFGYVASTVRNAMVLSTDSMIVPETGDYLILYSGRGSNNNTYDLLNGSYDTYGRTGVLNVTNNLNWVGQTYADCFSSYLNSNGTTTFREYIVQTFVVNTYAHLNAGDVLKVGAYVASVGAGPFSAWDLSPFKLQLIKLN